MKKTISFIMALAIVVSCIFTSCGVDDEKCTSHTDINKDYLCDNCTAQLPDTRMNYTVTVKNGAGELLSDVMVMIYAEDDTSMQNRLTMKRTKSEGAVSFTLEAGTYLVELRNTKDERLVYDTEKIMLTEARPNLTMTVLDEFEGKEDTDRGEADRLGVGSYSIDFTQSTMTYFVFVPTKAGVYQFSISSNTQVEIGYYGSHAYILDYDITNPDDRVDMSTIKITVTHEEIGNGVSGTTKRVIGVKGKNGGGSGIITVKKVGDVQLIPESKAPVPSGLTEYSYRGGVPSNVDITITGFKQKYGAVYNEADGYYHLCLNHISDDPSHECNKNGPIIYVRLASDDGYLNFAAMLEAGNGMKCGIYNAEGVILERRDYTEMMQAYVDAADSNYGLYPLTEGLREAIQNCGKDKGWFEKNNPNYLFGDATIMTRYEGAEYLIFCCYAE